MIALAEAKRFVCCFVPVSLPMRLYQEDFVQPETGTSAARALHLPYRPDIDGLRAIAVLAVVLFHFRESFLVNGYLGVDIFFVLSGFLITSIIVREVASGQYTLRGFYERRIRRIMPALLVLLLVTTIASAFILLPSDLTGYGKSLAATLGFVSNIYFWRDTNYFAPDAANKPLLHMWSLAVEEQFYIFYPLLLVFALRYLKRFAFTIILSLFLLSFALNLGLNYVGGGSPAFFMFPTRAWQLCGGALLALAPSSRIFVYQAKWFAITGVILLLAGLLLPTGDYFGIIPLGTPVVFGTMLLIWSGKEQQPVLNQLLSAAPFVSIGKVSYSLYLWHWPIVVLWQYYQVRPLSIIQIMVSFAAMMILSFLSTHYIERPVRQSSFAFKRLLIWVVGGTVLLACCAAVLVWSGGLPQRLNKQAASINASVGTNYRCPVNKYLQFGPGRACELNLPSRNTDQAKVILLGNSHAQMYAPLWEDILQKDGVPGLLVPQNGCLPTTNFNISAECNASARAILDLVKSHRSAKLVILGFNWDQSASEILVDARGTKITGPYQMYLQTSLDSLIDELQASGKSVILTGPIATPNIDIASQTSRQLAFGHRLSSPLFILQSQFNDNFGSMIEHFSNRDDTGFVRPDKVQCAAGKCYFIKGGQSLFADSNHLSVDILPLFSKTFSPIYSREKNRLDIGRK
jgi:peptidoglycan/LPS O-acetylase OafA/YrhL